MKLSIYPQEICQSPYYIFAEMNDKENQLNKTIEEQAANLYERLKLVWKIYNKKHSSTK